jgi:glycosyltransferase involved in cell wall biosynthesis
MSDRITTNCLKVAFVVGNLGLGGAEKQLVYMARALRQLGVQICIYCLTKGEYYESILREIDLNPFWIGKLQNPLLRLLTLALELRSFRPHIIQSAHFYTNLYTALVSPLYGAVGIGCLRSDTFNEVNGNGYWGMKLLKAPQTLISNSHLAKSNAVSLGVRADRIFVLPNAIDLEIFDREYTAPVPESTPFKKNTPETNVVAIGTLFPEKRFDRFLRALQKARKSSPGIRGFIVGDGEERDRLQYLASDLGLLPDGVCFIGRHENVPSILRQADIFVLSSDSEGMPNVILEAMAARLPVITTPAGDASVVVENGVTGHIVPFDDIKALADHMINLSSSLAMRQELGEAGRRRVEKYYSYNLLGDRLLRIYSEMGFKLRSSRLQKALRSPLPDNK